MMLRALTVLCLAVGAGACAARATPQSLTTEGNAWLLFIDDLHLDFRNTGRLRDLLRQVATAVIKKGDAFMVRASGPSQISIDWTVDHPRLQEAIKRVTGNGLKPSDIIQGPPSDPLREVLYRASIALTAASELVNSARGVRARRVNFLYVSNGYDLLDPGFRSRLFSIARRARNAGVRIFTLDPRMLTNFNGGDLEPDPEAWRRHLARTQETLRLLSEESGGFAALEQDPAAALKKIAALQR
jgi:hypothetical protein